MTAADLFASQWISLWVSGAAMVGLALWLFLLDVSSRPQRVFALLLGLRGLTFLIGPVRGEADTVRFEAMWTNLAAYLVLPLVPLAVYFVSVYPRPRRWASRWWWPALVLSCTLGAVGWYLLDHAAYGTRATEAGAITGLYSSYGPLYVLGSLRVPVFALVGVLLAGTYRRSPEGSRGFSLFLVVASFLLNGLFDGALAVVETTLAFRSSASTTGAILLTRGMPALALPIAAWGCLRLLPVLKLARTNKELQEVTRFFVAAVPLALVSPLVRLVDDSADQIFATFVLGLWRLLIPFLVVYALMRYQLFDIDLRLKAGARRAILVGAFTLTFFLVSEAAESLLQEGRGTMFGIVAAGALALASRPVKGLADRAADRFMPDTKPIAEQTFDERVAFYLEQFRLVTVDGQVTPKERRMLSRLQRTLSLSDEAVFDLETTGVVQHAEADRLHEPMPKPVRAKTADSRLEIAIKTALVAGAMALFFGMLSQGIESVIPMSGTLAGLLSAAAVALLLGPLETLADRLTHRLDPTAATEARDEKERVRAFESALATALEDGSLSPRDLDYLNSLQARLGIPWSTRWRLERRFHRRAAA